MRACALRSILDEKGRGWSEASSVTPAWKRRSEETFSLTRRGRSGLVVGGLEEEAGTGEGRDSSDFVMLI
ncbi:UNVERIFIED_CONTAM: hypothetical protein K2H54_036389 [Gekko kuhli]